MHRRSFLVALSSILALTLACNRPPEAEETSRVHREDLRRPIAPQHAVMRGPGKLRTSASYQVLDESPRARKGSDPPT